MGEVEFVPTVRRPYPPFYSQIMKEGEADKEEWLKFIGEEYAVVHIMQIEGVWYYPDYHMREFPKRLVSRLVEDEELFLRMKKHSLEREEVLKKAVEKSYEEYCKAYYEYMVALATYFACDDAIEEKVRELLEERLDKDKVEGLMYYLTSPIEDNYTVKEKLNLVRTENLEEHIKKYGWLHSRYGFIKEYGIEDAKKLLEKLKEENFLEKYEKEKQEIKEAIETAKEALGDKKHMIDVMQFFIYYRTQRTDVMNMTMYFYAPKLEEIAKSKGLTYEELLFCSKSEIDENRIINKEKIKERMEGYSIVMDDGEFTVASGEENKKIIEKYTTIEKKECIEGRTAYAGNVVGTARVIFDAEDIKKINEGEILVTSMTTSNMLPAMHKAAAFVTDEGGITCHACVVAREMKKPCIVGTKNATKILKDGDRIKVDAENGKVIILEEEK